MKDLHSHFIYGVDDGAKNIDYTKDMLVCAKNAGVKDIVFTPHYMMDTIYTSKVSNNMKIFKSIEKIAKELEMNVYLGNEVFINNDIVELYKKKEITTINNSRYMLIEIPLDTKINNVLDIFFEMISNGIIPILAHPERYIPYYKDLNFFKKLDEMGVLMQINFSSLTGGYGRQAKKMAKLLLKNNLISFVGSDIHSPHRNKYIELDKALKLVKKYTKEEKYIDIVDLNFDRVINNEDIR